MMPATALLAAGLLLAAGCGGTLEGKYRRGARLRHHPDHGPGHRPDRLDHVVHHGAHRR
jgi:hypothetical protein